MDRPPRKLSSSSLLMFFVHSGVKHLLLWWPDGEPRDTRIEIDLNIEHIRIKQTLKSDYIKRIK